MRAFFTIFILLIIQNIFAQRGFVLVKKNDRTIGSYTTGANISFTAKYYGSTNGVLAHIKTDSFSVLQYRIIRKGSPLGFVVFDTVYNGYTYFHKNDILSIKRNVAKGRIYSTIGGGAQLAGIGLTALNIANGGRFGFSSLADYGKAITLQGILPFVAGHYLKKLYKTHFIIKRKKSIALMQF